MPKRTNPQFRDYTLTAEEHLEHRRLLDAYMKHYNPQDPIALDLVEELAMAKLRQKRAWALEADLLRIEHGRQRKCHEKDFPQEGPGGRLALCEEWLADEGKSLDKLRRYEGQLQRAWHRCVDKLERRIPPQKRISQNEPKSAQLQSDEPHEQIPDSPPAMNRDCEGAATYTPKPRILPAPISSLDATLKIQPHEQH